MFTARYVNRVDQSVDAQTRQLPDSVLVDAEVADLQRKHATEWTVSTTKDTVKHLRWPRCENSLAADR